jgi:hypothetical protein
VVAIRTIMGSMRRLTLILVSAATLLASAPDARARCSRATAVHTARHEAAEALTRRRYTQALKRKGLEPVSLEPVIDDERVPREHHPIGERFVVDGVAYVAGPDVEVYRPGNTVPLDFARDAAGDIWLVDHLQARYRFRSVALCGCPATGGGAPSPTTQLRYRLPDGVTFRGQVSIRHDVHAYAISYDGRNADGSSCGPPP